MFFFRAVVLWSVILLYSFPVTADDTHHIYDPTVCLGGAVQVCGQTYFPPTGLLGAMITLELPTRFVNRNFTLQCISLGEAPFYRVTDNPSTLCELKNCAPNSNTRVCGTNVAVNAKLYVGDSLSVDVPSEYLAPAYKDTHQHFTALCAMSGDAPLYKTTDTSSLSCNAFACQPTVLKLCNSDLSISQQSTLGDVLHPVFNGANGDQTVTVQCLGTNGERPTYQITDNANVSCN